MEINKEIENIIKEKNIKEFINLAKRTPANTLTDVDKKTGFNALHLCVFLGASTELTMLLKYRTDLDLNKKTVGVTPKTLIELAISNNDIKIAQSLLENGKNLKVSEEEVNKLEKVFSHNALFLRYLRVYREKAFPKKSFWFF